MRYGDFLGSLSLASSHSGGGGGGGGGGGDFPIQSSTWRVKVNRLKPRAPILYTYTEHAQFVDVS